MKQLILSVVAACSLAPAFAQKTSANEVTCCVPASAQKGSLLYYGSLGGTSIESGNGPTVSSTAMFINSGLGYNLSNHFTLGVQGGFSRFHSNEYTATQLSSPPIFTQRMINAGAFGRYTSYLSRRIFVYAQANVSYIDHDMEFLSEQQMGLDVFPGIGLNIGGSWALNASVEGMNVRTSFDGGGTFAKLNVGQGYTFGIQKTFGGRHKASTAQVTEK